MRLMIELRLTDMTETGPVPERFSRTVSISVLPGHEDRLPEEIADEARRIAKLAIAHRLGPVPPDLAQGDFEEPTDD